MPDFLNGGGEMGSLMRAYPWEQTPVGPPNQWPPNLRTSVSIILHSKFPMFLWWGEDLIQFYNDAYRPSLGNQGKHPAALGQKGASCWPEIWPIISPLIEQVRSGGESVWAEDQLIPIYRNGAIEEVYWTFSYSPVIGETEKVEGVLVVCSETTDKLKNARILAESDNQLRFAIDAAELAIWDYDPATDIFIGNERLKEWLGLPDVGNWHMAKAISAVAPTDQARVIAAFEDVLQVSTGGRCDIEFAVVHPFAPNERIVRAKGRAWFHQDGKAYRFNGTLQDITNQAKSREQLATSERLFRTFCNNIQNLAWMAEPDGYIYWYNERWYDFTGSKPEDMVGWGWQKAHHPAHIDRIVNYLQHAWLTPEPFELTFPLRRSDGQYRWFLTRAFPVLNSNGQIERWVGTNTDIHEQKIAEDRFRTLAESLPNLVWITDEKGNYEYTSHRWIEYSGHDPQFDENWERMIHPDDMAEMMNQWSNSLSTGNVFIAEARLKNIAGEYRWHLAQGEAVKDQSGKIVRWIGSLTDIQASRAVTDNLEHEVIERTKELERSNEDLQQFAHVVSHDLKEPVRKIRIFAGRLEHEAHHKLTEREHGYIVKVMSATDRMFDMINGVLAYSTLGSLHQILQSVDLNSVIQNVQNDLELMIHQKEVTFVCSDLPIIESVPVLIQQLFYNLINNSLKFGKDNEPLLIIISAKPKKIKRSFSYNTSIYYSDGVEIELADNGIGFDPEYSERIFKTFTRLNSKDQYEGTGLGLPLCRKIVERHGGTITAVGEEGKGARFIITLPLLQAAV